ncbi:MAG: acyl carrier protein [bacterium]
MALPEEAVSKIKALIAEQLSVDIEKVTDEASFIEDLGADSLDTVELVMALEEEYGVDIPDDDVENVTTVKDVIAYIEDRGIEIA